MARMNKSVVLGLIVFIMTEVLCVIALFSSDWLVSDYLGEVEGDRRDNFYLPPLYNHRQY